MERTTEGWQQKTNVCHGTCTHYTGGVVTMLTQRTPCSLGWANTATAGKKSIIFPVITSIITAPEVLQ